MAEHPTGDHTRDFGDAGLPEQAQAVETVHHEPTAKKRRRGGGVKELNLTSMLDVTFQLLIFFILTASFALDEGVLAANLPEGTSSQQKEEDPEEPIKIVISPFGPAGEDVSIWIEGRERLGNDYQRLFEILNGWRYDPQQNPGGLYEADNPIIIKPVLSGGGPNAQHVKWKHIVATFNACVRAKYTSISFAQSG